MVPFIMITIELSQPLFGISVTVPLLYILDFIFNLATHSNFGAAHEASQMDTVASIKLYPQVYSHQQWCIPTKDSLPL